jgi:hypothetical protein
MEPIMRMTTDESMYDTNEHYDLIFTPAGSIVDPEDKVVVVEEDDWISGDIVNW